MRKFAVAAAVAVAASLGITSVASAANTYTVNLARVTPTKAGTTALPKPARIEFGYLVGSDNGARPAVTTDYIIGFGAGIQSSYKVRDAKTKKPIWAQCPLRSGSTNTCAATTKIGSGIVDNKFGAANDPSQQAACRLNLTLFAGDGKLFPPSQNDGQSVKADVWLGLKSIVGQCPITVDAALPAQIVRYKNGTALRFHVPKVPFQQPLPGVENAVVQVTSNTFKTKRGVNTKVGTKIVKRTRGFWETKGCFARAHRVEVQFTNTTGQQSTAFANAPCTK